MTWTSIVPDARRIALMIEPRSRSETR